jgi:hypothetical protein
MFPEELSESGYRYIKGVVAIMLLKPRKLRCSSYTSRLLEISNNRLRVEINRVCKRRKGFLVGIIKKAAFLEKERYVLLASSL